MGIRNLRPHRRLRRGRLCVYFLGRPLSDRPKVQMYPIGCTILVTQPNIIHNLFLSTQPCTELCTVGVSWQVFLYLLDVMRRNIIIVLQIIFIIPALLSSVIRSVYQLCCCLGREKPQTVLSTRFLEELTCECYVFIL